MTDQSLSSRLASSLLEIGAVVLQPDEPFTWASGIKSPIYCDNRLTMSFPETRKSIAQGFINEIRSFSEDLPEVIVGTATAGIPHAAWVSEGLELPMAYVRSKAKAHGKQNQIEGLVKEGQRVVVIEDLISTGMSSLKAVHALEELGADVDGVLAIFTYGLDAAEKAFADAGVSHYALTNYEELLKVAVDMEFIDESDLETLRAWRSDPESW